MSVKIIEMLAPIISSGARSGLKRTGFKGVTIHNTGNSKKGANAKNHGVYLQDSGKKKQQSWHYSVDEDCAVRSIPENEIAWHAGDGRNGNGNCKTIAIEICMNSDGNLLKATDNAAELTADILRRNGITKAVSGQNVFQHYNWSGKNCPQMIRAGKPYSWNTFISKVNAHLGATTTTKPTTKEVYRVRKTWADTKSQKGAYSILENAKKTCDKNIGYKVFNSKGIQVYPEENVSANIGTFKPVVGVATSVAKPNKTTTTTTSTTVKTYKVVKNIKGYTNAANAKNKKNAVATVKAGTYYIFNEADGMKNVTKTKGKPGSWINPSDNVVTNTTTKTTSSTIKTGDKVKVTKPYDRKGVKLIVFGTYNVIEGQDKHSSYVVIGKGKAVTAAMPIANVKKVK